MHVLHRDGLVTDRTKIPDAVSEEDLGELLGGCKPGAVEDGGIDSLEIPAIQCIDQTSPGLRRRFGHGRRFRSHRPAARTALLFLRALEIVERPEHRQPTLFVHHVERCQVDGLQRKHRVVLEADMGEGLDVARRRDGQSGQGAPVIETSPDQDRKLCRDTVTGCLFQEAMQGTDLRKRPCQAQPATQAQRGCATGGAQKRATIHGTHHRLDCGPPHERC